MVKLLFVLMNEYRLWALPQALAALERRYPGAVEGRVYSVREINADAGLERALLADGAAADMAFLASHGSIQNLYCFSRLWEALEGRPVYFTSTMGDELAELLPRLGLEPALYAALDSYYQAGSPADLEGLVQEMVQYAFGKLETGGSAGLKAFSISDVRWEWSEDTPSSWQEIINQYKRVWV